MSDTLIAPPVTKRWHLFRRRANSLGLLSTPISSHDTLDAAEDAKSKVILKPGETVHLEEEV